MFEYEEWARPDYEIWPRYIPDHVCCKKPKAVKPPPPPAPAAVPESAPEAGEDEAKRVRKQMGYQSSILTGNLKPKSTGKRATLG